MTTAERIVRARTVLVIDQPFFGTLVTRLPMERNTHIQTMETDGTRIAYNPAFVASLTDDELVGVIAHEVMHIAAGHPWRREEREARRWNTACDLAINPLLTDCGMRLPAGALEDAACRNMDAEAIYRRLPPSPANRDKYAHGAEKAGCGPQSRSATRNGEQGQRRADPGGCGAVRDAPSNDRVRDQHEAEWRVAVSQAAKAASKHGRLPGSLARLVKSIVNPAMPWRVMLRDFVVRAAANDYNWNRPNRKYVGAGIVMPSMISDRLPDIVVAVDTSGSITQSITDRFAAEISAILMAYDTTIHVVYADAAVTDTETWTREGLPLRLNPKGGGGTDFRPVFEWVEKRGLTPACLVYLTDMRGRWPEAEPPYPVLWAATTADVTPPFGITASMA